MANFMKKIFITRDLEYDSIFYKMLTVKGFDVVGCSLVTFSPVSFDTLPPVDWIFFYSKNAVRFFLTSLENSTLHCKIAALGEGTASVLKVEGFSPDFIGKGDPAQVAMEFLSVAEGCRVLFPRASDSRQSIQKLIGKRIKALDLVVYENIANIDFQIPECQALVFTSPLNVKAYFSKYELKSELVIAIGETTAAALRQFNVPKINIAKIPSEEAMAELVIKLLRK